MARVRELDASLVSTGSAVDKELDHEHREFAMDSRLERIAVVLALCAAGPARGANADPVIEIDSLPPYATEGFLGGRVSGADPSQHHVAAYLHIDGLGWFTKPTLLQPTVPIAPDLSTPDPLDGTFAADVVSGGIDDRAILYCAALFPLAQPPPTVVGGPRIPSSPSPIAIDCAPRFGPSLDFSGYRWGIKEAPALLDPGSNLFSSTSGDVFVDGTGRLHLRASFDGTLRHGTEVILDRPLAASPDPAGTGVYVFETESDAANLDPNLVFGAFLWDPHGDQEGPNPNENREIDFEASRWGKPSDPLNAQSVVQPFDSPSSNREQFSIPAGPLLWLIAWQPDKILFQVFQPGAQVYSRSYTGDAIPDEGRTAFHFNLWVYGTPPAPTSPAEVVISSFRYVPEASAALQLALLAGGAALLARSPRATRPSQTRPASSRGSSWSRCPRRAARCASRRLRRSACAP